MGDVTVNNVTNSVVATAVSIIVNGTTTLASSLSNLNSLSMNITDHGHRINGSISGFNGSKSGQPLPGTSSGMEDPSKTPTTVPGHDPLSVTTVVGLSILFFLIVVVGIVGNALVIFVVLTDRKMRQSVTNLLILNLAVADLVIMVLGVPEIVQFIMAKGWLLGPVACRVDRFLLVVCLYASVLSLVSLCIERFIAIIFPIKAHVVCTRRKILYVIAVIWPVSIGCGLPTAIFNQVAPFPPVPGMYQCLIVFPDPHVRHFLVFKLVESAMFYFLPLIIQVALYAMVAKRLYASMEELQTRFQMRPGEPSATQALNGGGETRNGGLSSSRSDRSDRAVDTIRARKGVVKMLVASVVVYTISYSPHQVHLLYNTFSDTRLPDSWHFFVFVMVMTHINSAANPVLYSIFSQNFRRNFKRCLCYACYLRKRQQYRRTRFDSFDSRGVSRRASTTRTTISRV